MSWLVSDSLFTAVLLAEGTLIRARFVVMMTERTRWVAMVVPNTSTQTGCLRVDYHSFFFVFVDSRRHKLFLFDKPHTMRGRTLKFKGAIRDIYYGHELFCPRLSTMISCCKYKTINSMREFFRPKSVSRIEADDHFKEADARTKHIMEHEAKYHLQRYFGTEREYE